MSTPETSDRELVLTRTLNASPAQLFRAWTEPEFIKQWFVPPPYSVASVESDLRPGGSTVVVMRSPEGHEFPSRGVYLEIAPDRKLVFTDAYVRAWEPSAKPFMTATITFEPQPDGKTLYTAHVAHWTKEDREAHENMGFHTGWGTCADQLDALASTL